MLWTAIEGVALTGWVQDAHGKSATLLALFGAVAV